MKLLLDTTVLIDIERRKPAALALATSRHELCISTVTANEFFFGAAFSSLPDARKNAAAILNQFRLLDVDTHVAISAAVLEAHFQEKHVSPGKPDLLIAMTAVTYGCDALVTTNVKHFAGIDALKGKVKTPQEIR